MQIDAGAETIKAIAIETKMGFGDVQRVLEAINRREAARTEPIPAVPINSHQVWYDWGFQVRTRLGPLNTRHQMAFFPNELAKKASEFYIETLGRYIAEHGVVDLIDFGTFQRHGDDGVVFTPAPRLRAQIAKARAENRLPF